MILFMLVVSWFFGVTYAARDKRGAKPKQPFDNDDITKLKEYTLPQLKKLKQPLLQLYTNRLNLQQGTRVVMAEALFNHLHQIDLNIEEVVDEVTSSESDEAESDQAEKNVPPPKKKQKRKQSPPQPKNSENEGPAVVNEGRVLELLEISIVKMIPQLAEAVNNYKHNKPTDQSPTSSVDNHRIRITAEDDTVSTETDESILRARALLSRDQNPQPLNQRCISNHQYPADILPPVSEKILKSIKNGEFIDFSTLLPSLALHNPNNIRLEISPDAEHGDQVIAIGRQTHRPKITNFQSWLTAWNTYVRCMLHFHAHLLSQLLYYQAEMAHLAILYSFSSWVMYDWNFRTRLANKAIARWDHYDTELRARHLVVPLSPQSSTKCWRCDQVGHMYANCPLREPSSSRTTSMSASQSQSPISFSAAGEMQPFRAPQRASQMQRSANIPNSGRFRTCTYFNQERGCINPNCNFIHQCAKCQQSGHSQQHCRHR